MNVAANATAATSSAGEEGSTGKNKSTIRAIYNAMLRNVYKIWCFVYRVIPSKEQVKPMLDFKSWKRWFHYVLLITLFPHLKQILFKLFPHRIDVPPPHVDASPPNDQHGNPPSG